MGIPAGIAGIAGAIIDLTTVGLTVAELFETFRKSRPQDETREQAAAAFTRHMVAQVVGEDQADDAVAKWRTKHGLS